MDTERPQFRALIAPSEKKLQFRLCDKNTPDILQAKKTNVLSVFAVKQNNLPCTFAVATETPGSQGKPVRINGFQYWLEALPVYKTHTAIIKEEEQHTLSLLTYEGLSLEFGTSLYYRNHRKRKKLQGIMENMDSPELTPIKPYNSQNQDRTGTEEQGGKEKIAPHPKLNPNAAVPADMYDLDHSIEISTRNMQDKIKANPDITAYPDRHIIVSDTVRSILAFSSSIPTLAQNKLCALIILDAFYRVLIGIETKNLNSAYDGIPEIQEEVVRDIRETYISEYMDKNAKVRMNCKALRTILLSRMLILILIIEGGHINVTNLVLHMPSISYQNITKLLMALGCRKTCKQGRDFIQYSLQEQKRYIT